MKKPQPEHDLLKEIPSPSVRLGVGLCITLAIFLVFAFYTIREIRWLEDFQANVVQKNRKASLQLLRLQDDVFQLAVSLRDMTLPESRYPIYYWKGEFTRLHQDANEALALEGQYAVATPAGNVMRRQLRDLLDDFWQSSDVVFTLADQGHEATARYAIRAELEGKRDTIARIVSRLLTLNDQAQAEAGERVSLVYGKVKKDILGLIGILFLVALSTSLYTLQANRKTFERLHHLAERLQTQSEQLSNLSWKLIEVQEETLKRVSRDLHDEFGQILTALGAMLSRAEQKGLAKDSVFVEEVQKVKQIVAETLESVRNSSQLFRPAILDDFGLEQTLEWFVQQFSRQTGIQVHFERELAEGFFPREDAIHIYRILQEALNNVARHSKAQEAWVTLRENGDELGLEIRDNGAGFDAGSELERAPGDGIGLMGMRERAQHLNGTFTVRSVPGGGTVLNVRIPVHRVALRTVEQKAG
jgi:signal transduction histidine kinase